MKYIETTEKLLDKLDKDLAWRKKEIYCLFSRADPEDNPDRNIDIRVCLAFIYAHWEGYIKNACKFYLTYIISQNEKFSDLKLNFLSMRFFSKINEDDNSYNHYNNILHSIFEAQNENVNFDVDTIIKTYSNLTSSNFKTLLIQIGIEENLFELNYKLIDEKLVKYRHTIAHGENRHSSLEEARELRERVITMLDEFRERLYNAAFYKEYKR